VTTALEGGDWSAARPGRNLPRGKTRYKLYRRLGGPQGRSGRGGKSRPHRNSIPDRPAHSQSLYRLSYRAHPMTLGKGRSTIGIRKYHLRSTQVRKRGFEPLLSIHTSLSPPSPKFFYLPHFNCVTKKKSIVRY